MLESFISTHSEMVGFPFTCLEYVCLSRVRRYCIRKRGGVIESSVQILYVFVYCFVDSNISMHSFEHVSTLRALLVPVAAAPQSCLQGNCH